MYAKNWIREIIKYWSNDWAGCCFIMATWHFGICFSAPSNRYQTHDLILEQLQEENTNLANTSQQQTILYQFRDMERQAKLIFQTKFNYIHFDAQQLNEKFRLERDFDSFNVSSFLLSGFFTDAHDLGINKRINKFVPTPPRLRISVGLQFGKMIMNQYIGPISFIPGMASSEGDGITIQSLVSLKYRIFK